MTLLVIRKKNASRSFRNTQMAPSLQDLIRRYMKVYDQVFTSFSFDLSCPCLLRQLSQIKLNSFNITLPKHIRSLWHFQLSKAKKNALWLLYSQRIFSHFCIPGKKHTINTLKINTRVSSRKSGAAAAEVATLSIKRVYSMWTQCHR